MGDQCRRFDGAEREGSSSFCRIGESPLQHHARFNLEDRAPPRFQAASNFSTSKRLEIKDLKNRDQAESTRTSAKMGPRESFVFLSIFDWWCHSHGHSDIQVARILARDSPVLFVNSIGMRFPSPGTATAPLARISRKFGSICRPQLRPVPSLKLTVMTPIFAPLYKGALARLNERVVARQIAFAMRGLEAETSTVVVTAPTYARIACGLTAKRLLYYRSDLHSAFTGGDAELIREYEDVLFERADTVMYSNRSLYEQEAPRRGKKAFFIGHGVDLGLFSPCGPLAPEIEHLPRPRVGFFGELRERSIDFAMISGTAALLPSVQFVLGGTQLDDTS